MKKIFLVLFLFPLFTWAQITVTKPVAGLASTTNGSSYAMTAFTPTANSLLVVFVHATGTVQTNPTMTGGSLTWTLRGQTQNYGGSGNQVVIFTAPVGASPVSTAPTFDCTGDAATGCLLTCLQFVGYDAASPVVQTRMASTTITGANASLTFISALNTNNAYAIAWASNTTTGNVSTPPTGWTEADDLQYGTPNGNMASAYRSTGESTTGPYAFTSASTTYYTYGIEIKVDVTTPHSRRITIIQ